MKSRNIKSEKVKSRHGSLYYRLNAIWASFSYCLMMGCIPAVFVVMASTELFEKKPLKILVGAVAAITLFIPLLVVGAVIGGLFGLVRGIGHAVTRKPLSDAKINRAQSALSELLEVDYNNRPQEHHPREIFRLYDEVNTTRSPELQALADNVIRKYESVRTAASSEASDDLLRSLKGQEVFVNSHKGPVSTAYLLREYLITAVVENNGKKLFNILCEALPAYGTPDRQLGTACMALKKGALEENCLFSRLPEELRVRIARATVPAEALEDGRLDQKYFTPA